MQTLRLFCDVARFQSFSQAAQRHHITQSAASQRVHALEKRLGVTLIDRSVRPLALTPAGEAFFHEGQELLERYDRLEAHVTRLRAVPSGEVRVDAIYSAGIDLLRHIEQMFCEQFPQVTVVIHYRRPEEVFDAVRLQQCDIGIVSYPQTWRGVVFIPLRDEIMAVVCSPQHPLATQHQVHASALGRWPMITFEPDLPVGRHVKRYLRRHGAEPPITNVFDNIDTLKSAVALTDQISILPKRTVLREVAAGTLAVLDLDPRLVRPLGIIHRRRQGSARGFNPAVQAFVDFLLEHAGPRVDLIDAIDAGKLQLVGGST